MPKVTVSQHHEGEWIADVILKKGGVGVGFFEIASTKQTAISRLKKRIEDLNLSKRTFDSIKFP